MRDGSSVLCGFVFIVAILAGVSGTVEAQVADTSWPMFQRDARHTGSSVYDGNPGGGIAWTFDTGGAVYGSPVLGADDRIYIGNAAGHLLCISITGSELWRFPADHGIHATVALGADGTIYFGDTGGIFYALRPDGSEKWRFVTGGAIYSSPVIAVDGTIYFASTDTFLYALDPGGNKKWE